MHSKKGDEVAKAFNSILQQDCYRQIQTDGGCECVNTQIKKVLLKCNKILFHIHSPIKVAVIERLIRTTQLLISGYCTLKNTVAFIQDLN